MDRKNYLSNLLVVAGAMSFLTGCTSTSQSEYKDAGNHAGTAASAVGRAVTADVKEVGHEISGAVNQKSDSNNHLSNSIRDALLAAPEVQTVGLRVEVSGRKVTLKGRVHSEVQNQQAEHIARDIAGSKYTVDDQLKVSEG